MLAHERHLRCLVKRDSLHWAWLIHVSDIDKSFKLALRSHIKLLFSSLVHKGQDCVDTLWLPDLLDFFIFWRKLSSKSKSSLSFFFLRILLLILLHLKLHYLDSPSANVWVDPFVGISVVDIFGLWSSDLINISVLATEDKGFVVGVP